MFDNCVIDEFSSFEEAMDSPMASPIQITPEEQPQPQPQQSAADLIAAEEGLNPLDTCILGNLDLFNQVIKDSQSISMRTLTRNGGTLHQKSNDDFVKQFDRIYGTMANGVRKRRIRKLLEQNPALLSADGEVVRKRICAYERLYGLKKFE